MVRAFHNDGSTTARTIPPVTAALIGRMSGPLRNMESSLCETVATERAAVIIDKLAFEFSLRASKSWPTRSRGFTPGNRLFRLCKMGSFRRCWLRQLLGPQT